MAFPIIETFRNDTKCIYLQLKKNGENEAKDMKLNGEQVGFPYLTHWCDCKLAKYETSFQVYSSVTKL